MLEPDAAQSACCAAISRLSPVRSDLGISKHVAVTLISSLIGIADGPPP